MMRRRRARQALARRLGREPGAESEPIGAPARRRSLLDEAELAMDDTTPPEESPVAADEETGERAREALEVLEPEEPPSEESLDAESLETSIEQSWEPADSALHEEQPLLEALLDEGEPLPEEEGDELEAEIEARAEDESGEEAPG